MNTLQTIKNCIASFSCVAVPSLALADNPILQTYFSPDPAPVVIDDTVFVFSGNDQGGDFFTMNGWRVASSTDMVNWTDRGTIILSHDDFPNAKEKGDWAAQCIRRNGKFYYYVTVESTRGGRAINVAVADRPEGPYRNPLGDKHLAGPNWDYIDPTVWIDDDGQAYLYWGNPKLYYAKLNEDMISFDGPVQVTDMSRGFAPWGEESKYTEGPWIHKRAGKYYMVYASHGVPEKISYSWSDSPTGPWEWKGVIMENGQQGAAFTNHSGMVDFKGRSFFFYHNQRLPGGGGFARSSAVEEFVYNPDGTIPLIKMTDLGVVEPIHFLDPFKRVEAETKAFCQGLEAQKDDNVGVFISSIHNNDFIKVRCVDFGELGADNFVASVSSRGNASIEIRLDKKDGELIGTLNVENTNGAWREQQCEVLNTVGKHDLFFIFKGAANSQLFNFDYWFFQSNGMIVPQAPFLGEPAGIPGRIEAENFDLGGNNKAYFDDDRKNNGGAYRDEAVDIKDFNGGYKLGWTVKGEWLEYTVNISKTAAYDWSALVSTDNDNACFHFEIDDVPVTSTSKAANTGDWDDMVVVGGTTAELSQGEHILKLVVDDSFFDIDWFEFKEHGAAGAASISSASLSFPLSASVHSASGMCVGTVILSSAGGLSQQLTSAGFPAGAYVVRTSGFTRVVFCK